MATTQITGRQQKAAIRIITDTGTATVYDDLIVCNKATAMTVNLLAAAGSGRQITIANIGAGAVTVDGNGSETINGEVTQTVRQHESMTIRDYASGAWVIV